MSQRIKVSHLSHFENLTPTHLPQNRLQSNLPKSSQQTTPVAYLTRRHRHDNFVSADPSASVCVVSDR